MNMETLMTYALMNNDTIVNSVAKSPDGIPLINLNRAPHAIYPLIEFHQIAGGDVNFADMEVFIERNTFQVTFYGHNVEYMKVRDELLKTLRGISFKVINEYSFKNMYTDINHYVIHVRSFSEQVYFDTLFNREKALYDEKYPEGVPIPEGSYFDDETGQDYYVEGIPVFNEDDVEDWEFL